VQPLVACVEPITDSDERQPRIGEALFIARAI